MDEQEFGLKDLLDSKFPLLERFRELAPGTHKHSQTVADFTEACALELDIDPTFMQVVGTYHDIGKINNPEVFSENQNGKNIHDDLDPSISYQLISRHVGDSVVVLLNNLPDFPEKTRVLEVVSQHHGNTVVQYFFRKSESQTEDHYRYKLIPPKSIEAAVLMICDSVAATSHSMQLAGKLEKKSDRRAIVNTTVDRLMQDFQLDDIKVGSLRKIKSVLYKELETIYHKREEYGGEKDSAEDESLKV